MGTRGNLWTDRDRQRVRTMCREVPQGDERVGTARAFVRGYNDGADVRRTASGLLMELAGLNAKAGCPGMGWDSFTHGGCGLIRGLARVRDADKPAPAPPRRVAPAVSRAPSRSATLMKLAAAALTRGEISDAEFAGLLGIR